MATYELTKILSDYEHGRMDVEMAMGHSLQHIEKLYEAQTIANSDRYELRQRVNALENEVTSIPILQTTIDHLQQLVDSLIAHTSTSAR
ncbi:hypothetical protein KFU94_48075 [Chloroflexi bacterium TSY]|nr:hypothetical protein [Chloroflexi bacterium TSY]